MNELYFESAVSAREFAASLGQGNGPNCQNGGAECGGEQCVCFCRPVPSPPPVKVEEGCCCKEGFRAALGLLCEEELAALLDFDLAAVVTDHYVAGAAVTETVDTTGPADNLVAPLVGSFRRLSPCSNDLVELSAAVYFPPAGVTGMTAVQANLCQLTAVVIQLAAATAEGELTAEEAAARNFRRVRRLLSRRIDSCGCRRQGASCPCGGEECCCAAGVLDALANGNLSRRVSLAAGPLLLSGVSLLGRVGNVLVLANDTDQRVYFLCVNKVEFIA